MTAWRSRVSALSPKVWLSFNSTGVPTDAGSLASSLTLVGSNPTTGVSSPQGSAYTFTGATRYSVSNATGTFDDKVFTIEAIVRQPIQTSSQTPTIFRTQNAGGSSYVLLRTVKSNDTTNPGRVQAYIQGTSATASFFSSIPIDDNNWHHVVLVVNGNIQKIYIDGVERGSAAISLGTVTVDSSSYAKYYAGYPETAEEDFNGSIDEIVIYDAALTATQILDNYDASGVEYGTAYNSFVEKTQSSNNSWQYFYLNNARTGATLLPNYQTGNEVIPNEPQWDNNEDGGNYPFVQRVADPNTNVPSGTMRDNFGGTPNLVLHPSSSNDNCAAIGWKNTTGYTKNVSGTITLKLANHTGTGDGIKYYLQRNLVNATRYNLHSSGDINQNDNSTVTLTFTDYELQNNEILYLAIENDAGYVYDHVITTFNIGIRVNYTNTTGATASTLIVDPVVSAVKNNNYTDTTGATASALIVDPAVTIGINVDGGGVSTASALFVDPVVTVVNTINYSADPATASATSPNATAAAQKIVNYSASPATASALISSNFYGGNTTQDTNYELDIRRINPSNNTSPLTLTMDSDWDSSGNHTVLNQMAIKPISGVPAYNKIVKAKINTATTYYNQTNAGLGRVEVRVFTANPNNGKTFDTMLTADLPASELLYITKVTDDGLGTLAALDLTAAFADSRAATYGIYVRGYEYPDLTGIKPTNRYSTVSWGSTTNQPHRDFLYILEADVVTKNVNADVITASALATDVTVATQKYVNVTADPSTASATTVTPTAGLSIGFNADPSTASGLAVQPAFNRTVEYPHTFAEAFATTVTPTLIIQGYNNYNATPATASALFHDPQTQIGDEHSAASMDGSALFVDPKVVLNRSVDAMVATVSGLMVQPTTNVQLLGVVLASPMTARAQASNPPAYLDLFGDPWYATLYAQHSVRHGLPAGYGNAFLKIFEDQNTDITQATPNTVQSQNVFNGIPTLRDLRNNVTYGMYVNSGPENDNRYVGARAITDYSTPANESRMSVGYFDNWNRKAIRLQNIGFATQSPSYSKSDFSMEFSIKTTKANQVLAYGSWSSPTSSSSGNSKTTYNLVDGKLNVMTYGLYDILHPYSVKPVSESSWNRTLVTNLTGNSRIDDGQWHHVVIQFVEGPEMDGGIVGRLQYWIDGNLDIQRFNQNVYDPDTMGANIENAQFSTDYYTSAFSIDAPGTVAERDIDLHYYDFIKYEPILAEPMTASLTMTSGNTARGNRGRALMLYWWPTSSGQNQNQITRRFDSPVYSGGGEFDINMSPQELETIDYINRNPQQYFGWDVFPVDINGYYVSDLVKESAYGGVQNIVETTLGGAILTSSVGEKFKVNRRGYFRNTLDDTRRYIDLVNDIDLSQFDAIFFKNYPDQSNEVDAFARNEIVDPYFNLRETVIYENFIKSLRAAVDTGISLMINNPQLALDLKIIDRIEVVPDLTDGTGYYSDPYTPTILPDNAQLPVGTGNTTNIWTDTYRNNRIRILNTLERLTDYRSIIYTEAAYWNNDDTLNYGGANRPFRGYQYKSNGLSVGDEFFISTFNFGAVPYGGGSVPRNYLATPISSIKSGTPITAFANQYRKGLDLVANPYKDYVTTIAIKPGDVLDGKQVGGKIWVNFTDAFNDENEYAVMDAIHTEWINYAYNEGSITLTQRNALLASPYLLETKLANGEITQSEYNKLVRWQSNGMFILTQTQQINEEVTSKPGEGNIEKVLTRKFSKDGVPSTQVSYVTGPQFFTFTYARQFEQLTFAADSMNTRGLRWLSSRVATVGQNQAHTAMPASATMVQPIIIGEKQVTINVQAMLATATKMPAVGYEGNDRNIISLPLEASARITEPVKKVSAEPMTASAAFREQLVIRTTAQDQVVVYVLHEDPILYLREDIIK